MMGTHNLHSFLGVISYNPYLYCLEYIDPQKNLHILGAVSTQGLHWLATLHDKEFNGILADEILGFWMVILHPEVWTPGSLEIPIGKPSF